MGDTILVLHFGAIRDYIFFLEEGTCSPVQQLGDITTCLCKPCSSSHGPVAAAAVPAITSKEGRKDRGGCWEMKPLASAALHYNRSGQAGRGTWFPTRAGVDLTELTACGNRSHTGLVMGLLVFLSPSAATRSQLCLGLPCVWSTPPFPAVAEHLKGTACQGRTKASGWESRPCSVDFLGCVSSSQVGAESWGS